MSRARAWAAVSGLPLIWSFVHLIPRAHADAPIRSTWSSGNAGATGSSMEEVPALGTTAHQGDREVETACNGLDDDGDGLVDILVPGAANACTTSRRGACGAGTAACENGKRICFTPPPLPEVQDGIDNDCNGIVDDVPAVSTRPRAIILAPTYVWTEALADVDNFSTLFAQAGIPYDRPSEKASWEQAIDGLDRYALAVIPGYLEGAVIHDQVLEKLRRFVQRGGVLVMMKPVGPPDGNGAFQLAGLRKATRRRDVHDIRFEPNLPPAFAAVDSVEERTLLLNPVGAAPEGSVEAYQFELDPASGATVVARGRTGSSTNGPGGDNFPVVTRRQIGLGAVYVIGHDLVAFSTSPCYVNCFEPNGDMLRLILDGALREGSDGHVALLHTVPGSASSVLILSHDIDAPDADNAGAWGAPGALQVAAMERARGLRATYNITTDYVTKYFNPQTIASLCDRSKGSMCPLGAHSVTHTLDFLRLPRGTCQEKKETYDGKTLTLCGEVGISIDMVQEVTGTKPRVFRAPYLEYNPELFRVLAANGVQFDSSFGIGDLPYNLPLNLATTGVHQDRFHQVPILEMPVSCEDGLDAVNAGAHQRVELQAGNRVEFQTMWEYVTRKNAANRSFTTLLLHPSAGRTMPPENVKVKVDALAKVIDRLATADVVIKPMEEVGDFWRMRLNTQLDASYDSKTGYTGSLVFGAPGVAGLTLEFGDAITRFDCGACGPTKIVGKRVTLLTAVTPGARAPFVASTK